MFTSNEIFKYIGNTLFCDEVNINEIAKEVPTPFYCYSANSIIHQYRKFRDSFLDIKSNIFFAVKVNSNISILKLLAKQGAGADAVSLGEMQRAIYAGINAHQIVFSGVGKTTEEIDFAIENNIHAINVESIPELKAIIQRCKQLNKTVNIALRVNPDVTSNTHKGISTGNAEHKFGIPLADLTSAYIEASKNPYLHIKGIDAHIGSQITQAKPFNDTFQLLVELTKQLRQQGCSVEHINVGGGLGVKYSDSKEILEISEYSNLVKNHFSDLDCTICFEPGRYIVANSGIIVTKLLYLKKNANKSFAIIDTAMNDFLRPALYNAFHPLKPIIKSANNSVELVDIVGPVCETTDTIVKNFELEYPTGSDLYALLDTGAYGAVMASQYNSRPLIPEVLICDKEFKIIRKRPTFQEMIQLEK